MKSDLEKIPAWTNEQVVQIKNYVTEVFKEHGAYENLANITKNLDDDIQSVVDIAEHTNEDFIGTLVPGRDGNFIQFAVDKIKQVVE